MATGAATGPIQINPSNPGRTFSNISVDDLHRRRLRDDHRNAGPLPGRGGLHDGEDRPGGRHRVCPPRRCRPAPPASPPTTRAHAVRRAGSAQPDPEEGDFPASTYFTVDQSTLTRTPADSIGTFGPAWPTYDPVHNVIVEASIFEANFETDNNAMSEITVINPATGAVLARLPVANLIDSTEVA